MKKLGIILLVVSLVFSVAFVGCGNNTSAPKQPSSTSSARKVVKGKENETVSLQGDTAITVQQVLRNPEDKNMILLKVEIKNIGDSPKIYNPSNFYLVGSTGKTYTAALMKVPDPIITTNVMPDKTLSGYLGFSIGNASGDFTLVYQGATGNIEISVNVK